MSHSKMLESRRAKQRTRKDLALIVKREKKLQRQKLKAAAADAQKKAAQ